ncbi:3342_t:CDS:2 [Funneliformis geosporum]|nr:3342_t:CDS:2 [Funneliformis geosporum]
MISGENQGFIKQDSEKNSPNNIFILIHYSPTTLAFIHLRFSYFLNTLILAANPNSSATRYWRN